MALTDEARARGRAKAAANRAKKKAEAAAKQVINAPMVSTAPDEGALFDVEEAPEDLFPEEKEGALDKVFRKLGLKGTPSQDETYEKKVPQAKLTKAQQSLYDSFAPLAMQAFVVCAGWSWSLLGEDYKVLAPSEEVTEKIIAPLMRIYARSSKIGTSLNPNHIDGAASLAALIGYVWSSYGMYKLMKQEKEAYAASNGSLNGYIPVDTYQSGYGNTDPGRDAHSASNGNGGAVAQSNGAREPDIDLSHLSESERRSYDKLSKLRELDIASRARRSGRA